MTNKIFQKLVLVTAGTALSLAVFEVYPAHAAIITYDFTLNLSQGSGSLQSAVGNQYSGYFSYDDSTIFFSDPRLGGLGYTTLPTDFSLNFNNIDYTSANLVPYARGRGGTLLGFTPSGSTFDLTNIGLTASDQPGTNTFDLNIYGRGDGEPGFFTYSGTNEGRGSSTYSLRSTAVPEPENSVYGIVVLGFGWLLRKKIAFPKRTSN